MKRSLTLLALCALFFVSCKKDDETAAQPGITTVVATNANFSLLNLALNKANLVTTINSSSNLTVFAPDNDAFAASGITEAVINSLSADTLSAILRYHVLGMKVDAASVPASDAVTTLQGQPLYASKNANGVFVNGVKVKTADVQASNGVIHVISKVLFPPNQTIAQIAASNPNFSYLLAAVVRANLAGAVSGPGKFTVFAPVNAAFQAAGFASESAIANADANLITNVVKYHVLNTNVFASDLINNSTATTLQGGTLTVMTMPAASVKVTGSANAASNITAADIVATNGVIHVIDRVLLP